MSRLIWSPRALRDVQCLHRFLAEKNTGAAERAVKALRKGVRIPELQPGVGRPVEDVETEYREWLIDSRNSGYVVMYRFDGQTVVILTFRHQRELEY
ncbi:MAG: type II toxin-antitoxin system RelE/ParE family toxin [Methylibium sp.]|uniref:type II toxin-antitoxin system RelE/ParE family toxin n=1 Tax=Methylibium sp. TaxID=2067992 RepID=UPI0017DE88B5|nr:type II toxin-antitoxin system RelE/ParE family toxin [Methylibium sp.]MBA3596127.1 type II toxin-antitoxin system RelE/ParE family toxin [Methylibium sp.]